MKSCWKVVFQTSGGNSLAGLTGASNAHNCRVLNVWGLFLNVRDEYQIILFFFILCFWQKEKWAPSVFRGIKYTKQMKMIVLLHSATTTTYWTRNNLLVLFFNTQNAILASTCWPSLTVELVWTQWLSLFHPITLVPHHWSLVDIYTYIAEGLYTMQGKLTGFQSASSALKMHLKTWCSWDEAS